jgi:hypothetical protein
VLCALCVLQPSVASAALLMGVHGAVRALVIFPASWAIHRQRGAAAAWIAGPAFSVGRAQRIMAGVLAAVGVQALLSGADVASMLALPSVLIR